MESVQVGYKERVIKKSTKMYIVLSESMLMK